MACFTCLGRIRFIPMRRAARPTITCDCASAKSRSRRSRRGSSGWRGRSWRRWRLRLFPLVLERRLTHSRDVERVGFGIVGEVGEPTGAVGIETLERQGDNLFPGFAGVGGFENRRLFPDRDEMLFVLAEI